MSYDTGEKVIQNPKSYLATKKELEKLSKYRLKFSNIEWKQMN